jgi:putative endonuclease
VFDKSNLTWHVYLLKCSDGKTYTGCTGDLKKRISRHAKGQVLFTKTRLPVSLVTVITFCDKYQAFLFEKYLKSGSGRAFANKRFLRPPKFVE